jgi:penicillin-binding protein 1A
LQLRRRTEARPRRRRRIRKLRLLALGAVLFLLAAVAFLFGLVRAVASEIPPLDPAAQQAGRQLDTVIYAAPDASGQRRVLAILRGDESRVLVGWDDIAPVMRQAIVSAEDRRFYQHQGVDVRGIARALWEDARSKQVVEGGSTITQQFVKNAYIRNEQTLARKVREAALAWQLEQRWSKERILTAYLNTIYFGNGAYGIQQAARTYFDKGAKRLTLPEAALLAGIPADPSRYDPTQHPRAARIRREYVLQRMFEDGKISALQLLAARTTPLPEPDDVRLPGTRGPAPYFTNYVTDQLVATFGAGRVFGGGLEVTTTIDLKLQDLARTAIDKVLRQPGGPAAALVAIDPTTGAVKAMFGGTNFRRSQFNLATQAERQPGSSFKPIVLATALREGISPVTRFDSKPVTIDAGSRLWHVTNYEDAYLGSINLADAMVRSDNSVYAQLTNLVRPKGIVDTAHRLGIRSDLPAYFSIGLGAVAVNPLDMARAYATIANDGRRVDGSVMGDRPRVVDTVVNRRTGKERVNSPLPRTAIAPGEARTLTSILERVVQLGTGRRAAIPGWAVAGKTGTTDNYGDAWFVGYTPQLVVAVWVGYPNALTPMLTEFGGEPVAGGTLPAQIWKSYMTAALRQLHAVPKGFPPAPYLPAVETRVVYRDGAYRRDNGYCPGTRLLAYVSGREPGTIADCKQQEVTVPSVVGASLAEAQTRLGDVPLTPKVVYAPAAPLGRPGAVVKQYPPRGYLSAGDEVTIVVTKAEHGLVPNLVGSSVQEATDRLRRLRLRPRVSWRPGPPGTVLDQSPRPGVAAAPGLRVRIVAARARARATP